MAAKPKPIVVVGSINMDLVCRTPLMPKPGETVLGTDFVTVPGGKGANQAVAAAKLSKSSPVYMVGRVGADDFGARLLDGLQKHQVHTRHVKVTEGVASGIAMILVDSKGENSIVVAPGANHKLTPADVDDARDLIASAAAVVLQLEIPYEVVKHTIKLCRELGVFTILDPAPAPAKGLPKAFYGVSLITPNQTEAELLLGQQSVHVQARRPVEPKQVAADLLDKGPGMVVLKLGSAGAMYLTRDGQMENIKPFKVKVVDTTAAGDAFTGGLAVALSEGMEFGPAIRLANAAGALTCTGFGAQPALPSRAAVDRLIAGVH